ncbi:MAG TPA: xanthine dehydrogenase family protein subunit M, partial [Dehalococcoidia bacterium]
MIPAQFDYEAPSSLDEVLRILGEHGDAKLLAGGHSLIPLMKLRLALPSLLVDLRRVQELRGIRRENGSLVIGGMTTHAEVARSADVASMAPALAQAARQIGDRQVRARGTIGGSVAHNDPAADLPAVMLALDASFALRSASGRRVVPASELFTGMLETAVRPDEVLTDVRIPAAPRSAYAKFANPASHYAIVGVAAAVDGQGGRIGVTGAAPVAFRATEAENALRGRSLTAEVISEAAARAYDGRDLLGDIHASAEYRAALIG